MGHMVCRAKGYEMSKLDELMILIPTRSRRDPNGLDELLVRGAIVHRCVGRSDIAHARCLLAESALRAAVAVAGKRRWVLWLDDDHEVAASTVVEHLELLVEVREELGQPVALAGRYVKRGCPDEFAAIKLGPDLEAVGYRMPEVYSGLGAYMVGVDSLQEARSRVPLIPQPDGSSFGALFATGGIQNERGQWVWAGEDFYHCALLGTAGTPTYLAPRSVAYGHWVEARQQYVYPSETTVLPDSDPREAPHVLD